jgi:hypothetical protein
MIHFYEIVINKNETELLSRELAEKQFVASRERQVREKQSCQSDFLESKPIGSRQLE